MDARAGSANDAIVISSDEESPPEPAAPTVAVTDVEGTCLSRALRIQESGIVPGQPGLYCPVLIPANTFVCVYAYNRILSDSEVAAMSVAERDAVSRYAVTGPAPDRTLIIDVPIGNASKHVAAFANEPSENEDANMALHAERVSISDGRTYFVVVLYTCDAPVAAGTELTWHYGSSYQSVRDKEGYKAGRARTSKEPLNPPLERVVERILAARGDDVAGILHRLVDTSSSDSDESDAEYREQRPCEKQPRRVQPKRTAAHPAS